MCLTLKHMLLCGVAVIILISGAEAQCPDTVWTRTYGGAAADRGKSVRQTADGGFIIAGMTESYGSQDVFLVRTDQDGNEVWVRGYGGPGDDQALSVEEIPGGGYIIAGWTNSPDLGDYDAYLIRTDAGGSILWSRTYGGVADDAAESVSHTADGGYVVAGRTASFGAGSDDVWLLRLDADGDTLWTKTYGGPLDDGGRVARQTPDGGYIVQGRTESFSVGGSDIWLLKTDDTGDTVWTQRYGSSWDDFGYSLDQTADGGYLIAGSTQLVNGAEPDHYIVRTDPFGSVVWTRSYGGVKTESGNSILETAEGGCILAGWTNSFGAGFWDLHLVKMNAAGDVTQTRTYGKSKTDAGYCIHATSDGGYVVTGWTNSFGTGGVNVWLLKMEADVAGAPEGITDEKPGLSCWVTPNPSCGPVSIRYTSPSDSRASVNIYNTQGQKVRTLTGDMAVAGPCSVAWDGRDELGKKVPAGIYFVRIEVSDRSLAGKLLIVR